MATATPERVAVALSPVPGFSVKSRAISDALVRLTTSDQLPDVYAKQGQKIFVNIAWDPNVPPPASDDGIRHAMQGLETGDSDTAPWVVPVVLSDVRSDYDKAGHSAIVFDCVLNPSVKSRTLRDPQFKRFIIELAFQRIEAQTALQLSRQIGTPNIASKGRLRSRPVLVPGALYSPDHPNHRTPRTLVQEIPARPARSISASEKALPSSILRTNSETRIPLWSCMQRGSSIRVVFDVPGVTQTLVSESTLDVEPRRVLLHVPALYDLDLDLDAADSELLSIFGENETSNEALKLKHMRSLDVDNARAEWRVVDGTIVLLA